MKRLLLIGIISIIYTIKVFSQADIVHFHTRIEPLMKDPVTESGKVTVKFLLKLTDVSNTKSIYVILETAPDKEDIEMMELYVDKDKEGYYVYNKEFKSIRINNRMLVVEKEYERKKIGEAASASTYLIDAKGNKSKKKYYRNYFPN